MLSPTDTKLETRKVADFVWEQLGRNYRLFVSNEELAIKIESPYGPRLVCVEIQARDGPSDHVFLNLNEVTVRIRHGQHRKQVFAAYNHH